MFRLPLALTLGISVAGCASVRIESRSGEVLIEQRWGVLGLVLGGSATDYVAEVSGLGVASTPFGWSAGLMRQSWAALGPDCRIVIWADGPEHIATIRSLTDGKPGICIAPISPPEEP